MVEGAAVSETALCIRQPLGPEATADIRLTGSSQPLRFTPQGRERQAVQILSKCRTNLAPTGSSPPSLWRARHFSEQRHRWESAPVVPSFVLAWEGKRHVGGATGDPLPDRLLYRPSNLRAAARSLKNCFRHGNDMKVDPRDHCKHVVPWHQRRLQ